MEQNKEAENLRARQAKDDKDRRNTFLLDEEQHILRLAGKLCNRVVTKSDDEWSIALMAVDEALDRYDETRGDFWSFASYVMKNRLTDHYRKEGLKSSREILVEQSSFSGEHIDEEHPDAAMQKELAAKTAVTVNTDLRDEIEGLTKELSDFGISFFDLAGESPKSTKTREACTKALKAILTPPPLTENIKKSKTLPIAEILKREKLSRKLVERYRKYLITTVLIADGDYPKIADYIPFLG